MKNINKALAMAVMMSVFCGSAYAETPASQEWVAAHFAELGEASDSQSLAIGTMSDAGTSGTAVGSYAKATGSVSTAFGRNSEAINGFTAAFGHSAKATGPLSSSFGYYAQATAKSSVALGYWSVATEENTVSVGGGVAGLRRIVNVAEGENDTDAVNKKQMEEADADTLKKANEYTDQEIAKISGGASSEALEKLDNKINQTNDRVDRVGATAAALAGIHYQPMAKGQSQVAVGMGGYKGKKATALGLAYQISDRISGSVAGAANGSEHMFNVGFNYLFGQHSDKDIAQCAAVPGSVSLKEAELQSQVDSLKADNASMKAEIAELKAMVKALAAK
ncbi:MAG: YadA-like family protein [Phascolarctobacterium sp.]|nr:YadA-like family protein [Phascolarctobacterium sp.]